MYVCIDVMCLCANTAVLSQITTVSCTDADICKDQILCFR